MVRPALAILFLMLEWFTDTRALGFSGVTYVLNAAAVLHFEQSGFNIEPPVSWVLVFPRASVLPPRRRRADKKLLNFPPNATIWSHICGGLSLA